MIIRTLTTLILAGTTLLASQWSIAQTAPTTDDQENSTPEVDKRWLDRMPPEDRTLIDQNLGFALPAPPESVEWMNTEALSWDDLRGKVVVLHSWTSGNRHGSSIPPRLERMAHRLGDDADNVMMLLLHTPENVENAEQFITRRKIELPVMIDPKGEFCDMLGIFRQPVNLVIDKHGEVRFAGIKPNALPAAIKQLLDEEFNEEKTAEPRPDEEEKGDEGGEADFPPVTGTVSGALDIRNKQAPPMAVDRWINGRPNAQGKVVIVDFWATWCGPCVKAIPHMNNLADRFRDDVVAVGISDESSSDFKAGLEKGNLSMDNFRYYVALDSRKRMKDAIRVRSIPHVIVMSSDWVVRWQGHPQSLSEQTVEQIVKANRELIKRGGSGGVPATRNRWERELQ